MHALFIRLRGWVEASHPFPLAAVVLLTALVAIASAEGEGLEGGRLLLVLLGMLFSQLAIGWSNDYVDRENDRRHQPGKPVAAGRLDSASMPAAIIAVLLAALAVGIALGPAPFLFLAIGTAAGLSYNFWLKQTAWSWLPYIVAFSVLPLYVWSALDLFREQFAGVYVIALSLVPTAHIANVLPDIESDAASGRRNLTLIWGRARTVRIIAVCLLAPLLLALLSLPLIDYDLAMLGVVVLVYALLVIAALLSYRAHRDHLGFQLVALASVLFAGGWLAAV